MPSFNKQNNWSTDIHNSIGMKLIYDDLGFETVNSVVGTHDDLNRGIDYVGKLSGDDDEITIAERFRDASYKNFGDITIRYQGKANNRYREYKKCEADICVYGVTNIDETDFEWACVYFIKQVIEAFENGDIKGTIRSNKGATDSTFLCIDRSEIERIGALVAKYGY